MDVRDARPPEVLLGDPRDLRYPLDGKDLGTEGREDRGLVPAPCTHLEDAVARGDGEELGHQGDDVGLGDRLPVTDGEGVVPVRGTLEPAGTKRWRGTFRIASRTFRSQIPRAAIWFATIASLSPS